METLVSLDTAIDAATACSRGQLLEGRHKARRVDLDGNQPLHGRSDLAQVRCTPSAIVWAIPVCGLLSAESLWVSPLAR